MNSKVNYGLGVIMMCRCRFILETIYIYTIRVSDADNEGGYACAGIYGKSLYCPLNSVVNLKLI